MRQLTSKFILSFALKALLICTSASILTACSGTEAEKKEKMKKILKDEPFPIDRAEKTQGKALSAKITNEGRLRTKATLLKVLKNKLKTMVGEPKDPNRPHDIQVCLPKSQGTMYKLCHETGNSYCGSDPGCNIDIDITSIDIIPINSNTAQLNLGLEIVQPQIKAKIAGINCTLSAYETGKGEDSPAPVEVTANVKFTVAQNNNKLKLVGLEPSNPILNLDKVSLKGSSICNATKFKIISDAVKKIIKEKIPTQMITDYLCQSCADDATTCRTGSICDVDRKVCVKNDGTNKCVPLELGKEFLVNIAPFVPIFAEPKVEANLFAGLADGVTFDSAEGTLLFNARLGVEPKVFSWCAPEAKNFRPNATIGDGGVLAGSTINHTNFDFGVGLHKAGINYALWGLWASGALCIVADANQQKILTTDSMVVKSLLNLKTLNDMTKGEQLPVKLITSSNKSPTVTIGDNTVSTSSDGKKNVTSPLATVKIEKFNAEFQAFIRERWVHLFTVTADVQLPIAVQINDKGKLEPVIGDLTSAASNVSFEEKELIQEDTSKLESAVKGFLPIAVNMFAPQLKEKITAFDVPTFLELTLKFLTDGNGITGVDGNPGDHDRIGAFFSIVEATAPATTLTAFEPTSSIELTVENLREVKGSEQNPTPSFTFDANFYRHTDNADHPLTPTVTSPIEYRYRIDNVDWSNYWVARYNNNLKIESPVFYLEGDHTIEFEARTPMSPSTTSLHRITRTVHVDYSKPEITFADHVATVSDSVSPSKLRVRYRFLDAENQPLDTWSDWGTSTALSLQPPAAYASSAYSIEVEADDTYGNVNRATHPLHGKLPLRGTKTDKEDHQQIQYVSAQGNDDLLADNANDTGCSNTDSKPAGLIMLLLSLLGLLSIPAISTRKRRLLALLGLIALNSTACDKGEQTSSEQTSPGQNGDYESEILINPTTPSNSDTTNNSDGPQKSNNEDSDTPLPPDKRCKSNDACTVQKNCKDGFTSVCQNNGRCEECTCQQNACNTFCGTNKVGSCKIDGCHCAEAPKVAIGNYGKYASIGGNDNFRVAAAYNETYGDLMIQKFIDSIDDTKWTFIDGVPDLPARLNTDGPRKGIMEEGKDVGQYNSVAVEPDGTVHLAYEAEGQLVYSQITFAGDVPSVKKRVVLDSEVSSAAWTQIAVFNNNVHILYTVKKSTDKTKSLLKTISFPKSSNFESIKLSPIVLLKGSLERPCSGEKPCWDGLPLGRCIASGPNRGQCAAPTADCDTPCPNGFQCNDTHCVKIFQDYPMDIRAVASETQLQVVENTMYAVFYNGISGNTEYIKYSGGTWNTQANQANIVPGTSTTCPYAQMVVHGTKLEVACMNESTRTLDHWDGQKNTQIVKGRVYSTSNRPIDVGAGADVQFVTVKGKRIFVYQDVYKGKIKIVREDGNGTFKVTDLTTDKGFHGFSLDHFVKGNEIWIIEEMVDSSDIDHIHHKVVSHKLTE